MGIGRPFKKGQSGNPAGKPKGCRNKFAEKFIADLYADWQENGISVLQEVRVDKPADYLKVVASILPKQLNVKVDPLEEMTDEQLISRITELQTKLGITGGVGEAPGTSQQTH